MSSFIICITHQVLFSVNKIKKKEMGEKCNMHGTDENHIKIVFETYEKKIPLWKS
jgi:hypothetical protein